MVSRRQFLGGAGAAVLSAAVVSRAGAASLPEAPLQTKSVAQPPFAPPNGRPYNPVVTLNGWTLPWRMRGGWKKFHLVTEPAEREFAPGVTGHLWGYNGQSPGPTIECVGGDRVRIFVTNKLPGYTTMHWHGMILPAGMDGVGGLSQPHIPTGKAFVYEFEMKKSGTFMYHPRSNEMVQMVIGTMDLIVAHPKDSAQHRVDRDFVFLLAAYDIDPGSYTPRMVEMINFSMWTQNSRVFPGIDPLPVRLGNRVRIRMGNLMMTDHPMHLHGHTFEAAGTDGGWVQPSARWPEVMTDIAVGQMRATEFIVDNPGDWVFYRHKSHHTMSAMGHNVPTTIGVQQKNLAKKMSALMPDYMDIGQAGVVDMGEMEMPLPDNTLPMMTGQGPFGATEMGGTSMVMKVHRDLPRNNYADPGWYKHPKGTVAYEYIGSSIDD